MFLNNAQFNKLKGSLHLEDDLDYDLNYDEEEIESENDDD